jgi:hypothetical protein
MLNVLLVSALLVGHQGDAQAPQRPVFRAEAYVVVCPNTFVFVDKSRTSHGLAPSHGLTADNFQAFVSKQPVAVDVSEDPKQPGTYILSINPPSELRDGKSHEIHVQRRKLPNPDDDQWHDLNVKWTAVFAKPRVGL